VTEGEEAGRDPVQGIVSSARWAPTARSASGCNPFADIREPECLVKWQLLRLDLMTRAYMMTVAEYRKLAPLQEKMYRHMSRRDRPEMDDNDSWKEPARR